MLETQHITKFYRRTKVRSGGDRRGPAFCKETNKICKNALFFRIFSIFAFRCMVKLSLIGTEIAPMIAVKFSGLV